MISDKKEKFCFAFICYSSRVIHLTALFTVPFLLSVFFWVCFTLDIMYCSKITQNQRAQRPLLPVCSHVMQQPVPKGLCKNLKNSLFCVLRTVTYFGRKHWCSSLHVVTAGSIVLPVSQYNKILSVKRAKQHISGLLKNVILLYHVLSIYLKQW